MSSSPKNQKDRNIITVLSRTLLFTFFTQTDQLIAGVTPYTFGGGRGGANELWGGADNNGGDWAGKL